MSFIMQKTDDRKYYVYIHTNLLNSKKYIGITCRLPEIRWNQGRGYRTNTHFWRAIEKDGWDNFSHEIVAEGLTKQAAHRLEIKLIQFHKATNPSFGYNHSCGGEGGARYLTVADKVAARKQTCKKRYEKLKQDITKYTDYLNSNKELHKKKYHDPATHDQMRERLNRYKRQYRKNTEFLEKDRAATKKIKDEVKAIRTELLVLLQMLPNNFTEEEIYLITARKETNKDYVCQSKIKLQNILNKFK